MSFINENAQPHAQMIQHFWQNQIQQLEQSEIDFKIHPLPLARIKKVMKSDYDAKQLMISSEAPLIFSKACETFIAELTLRAWLVAEENKRRTLQRSDIAMAVTKSDQYDFLIDIVPREELSYRKYPKVNMGTTEFIQSPGIVPPGYAATPKHPIEGNPTAQFSQGSEYYQNVPTTEDSSRYVGIPPQHANNRIPVPSHQSVGQLPPNYAPQTLERSIVSDLANINYHDQHQQQQHRQE